MNVLVYMSKVLGTYDDSIFVHVHSYFVKNNLLYYDTFENYQAHQAPSRKRKFKYHFQNALLILGIIKYFYILINNQDTETRVRLGEVLFLIMGHHYIHGDIIRAFCILYFSILKWIGTYYELFHKLNYKMINTKYQASFFKSTMNNQQKLIILINTVYWAWSFLEFLLIFLFVIPYICVILYAYFLSEYNYNLLTLILSAYHFINFAFQSTNMVLLCLVPFLVITNVLRWKQDEIVKSLRYNLKCRNYSRFYSKIIEYHKFTRVISELSGPINIYLGVLYSLLAGMAKVSDSREGV